MNLEPPKAEIRSATRVIGGPVTPRKGPPKFKQRQTRQFKSKPPKKGVQGFGDDIPGMEGLGTGITTTGLRPGPPDSHAPGCVWGPSPTPRSQAGPHFRHHLDGPCPPPTSGSRHHPRRPSCAWRGGKTTKLLPSPPPARPASSRLPHSLLPSLFLGSAHPTPKAGAS
uniref:Retinal rod rhodopsin-sensitive cGMP 3',5'-cyclic phosphodiesterase subunit gamma n=1 Tax=Sus scrofa TaxID=9823 RepID=A0A8D0JGD7_PIG